MSPAKKKKTKVKAKPRKKAGARPKPKKKAAARPKPKRAAKATRERAEGKKAKAAKVPAARKTAPAPPAKSRAGGRALPRKAARAAGRRAAAKAAARAPVGGQELHAGPPKSHLGTKYACFACGAKFYDLNRPVALCPKCGTDQSERPKRDTRPARTPEAASARRRVSRSMAPLLDDDDDEAVVDDEIDLGLAGVPDAPDGFLEDDDVEEEETDET